MKNINSGLTLTGDKKLLKERDTVVYVHGWSRDGAAEHFPYASLWNEKGFNTLIYRWHCDSYDDGMLPTNAERRIWLTHGKLLSRALQNNLSKQLGESYSDRKELRIVGHSLGSQLASYASYSLKKYGSDLKVARLELLDPYFTASQLPIEAEMRRLVGSSSSVKEAMETILFNLSLPFAKVPVVSYISMGGVLDKFMSLYKMWDLKTVYDVQQGWITHVESNRSALHTTHIQAMGKNWLSSLGEQSDGGMVGYMKKVGKLLEVQHIEIAEEYFRSIKYTVAEQPRFLNSKGQDSGVAFSAAYETQDLKDLPVRRILIQEEGKQTIEFSDDVFKNDYRKRRSCLSRKGNIIYFHCVRF